MQVASVGMNTRCNHFGECFAKTHDAVFASNDNFAERIEMGTTQSEQVTALLAELAVLKEQNKQYEANPSEAELEAYRLRQQRHEKIIEDIKALAERQRSSEPATSV